VITYLLTTIKRIRILYIASSLYSMIIIVLINLKNCSMYVSKVYCQSALYALLKRITDTALRQSSILIFYYKVV